VAHRVCVASRWLAPSVGHRLVQANCQHESVKDRPTRAHEYLFLFSKSQEYIYDRKAILRHLEDRRQEPENGLNINTEPFADAHLATFPASLIKPAILAGTQPQSLIRGLQS
jgi:hypothetical protein